MIKLNCKKPKLTLQLNPCVEHQQEQSDAINNNSGLEATDFDDYYELFRLGQEPVAEVSTKKCGRKVMEDAFCAMPEMDSSGQFFFGVYDGHGGSCVSRFISQKLHVVISQNPNFSTNIEQAIREGFRELNSQILGLLSSQNNNRGGSTALCAINVETELYVINLGDSGGYLVNSDLKLNKLTREHTPSHQDEAQRIYQQHGLIIIKNGVARIDGELAVSRSFGDLNFINSGLIAEPEITRVQMTHKDMYLILATDGFWDLITQNELEKQLSANVENLTQTLMAYVDSKQTNFKKDNITLLIVDLRKYYKLI